MNVRLSSAAGTALLLASLSLYPVLRGSAWLIIATGAVIIVVIAGAVARFPGRLPAVVAALLLLASASPLLQSPWQARLAGATGVILAAAVLSARLLAAVRTAAIYVLFLLLDLNLVLGKGAFYGLPSLRSLHALGAMWGRALAEFGAAPPVPDSRAVSLFVAAGIGAAAVSVDILAVGGAGPGSRRAAAAAPVQCADCQ